MLSRKLTSHTLIFLTILLFAAVIRLAFLGTYPIELFGDELDVGYHAYSLGTTLRDYTGQFLPTYIHSFSEWRAPLLMYASIPFVLLFGLNEWGVRLTPAFLGILSIVLTYILTIKLTNNRSLSLLVVLALAIMPWHIHYSRASFEVTLLLCLLLGGLASFLHGFNKPKWLYVSAVCFALMIYTYSIATVFLLIFLPVLAYLYRTHLMQTKRSVLLGASGLALLVLMPFIIQTITGKTGERFSLISIFSKPEVTTNAIEIERNTPLFPENAPFKETKEISEKIIHNRPVYLKEQFTKNYFDAFSPQFLFFAGDPNPRESAGGTGELLLSFAVLLPLGFYYLITRYKDAMKIIMPLLVIAPIPAALTINGGTQATRLFLMTLPLAMLAGSGAYFLFLKAKQVLTYKLLLGFVMVLTVWGFFQFSHQYIFHNPVKGLKSWQYGYKDAIQYMKANERGYEKLLFSNRGDPTLLRALFWLEVKPSHFHKVFVNDRPQPNIIPGFDGFAASNMYFVSINDSGKKAGIENLIDNKTMYLMSQEYEVGGDWDWRKDPPSGIKVLHTVTDYTGLPMYYVITKQ